MKCIDCEDKYYVEADGTCQLCKPPLVYTVNKTCEACRSENCEVCNPSDLNRCKECKKGYYFQGLRCVPRFFKVSAASFSADKLEIVLTFEHKIKSLSPSNMNVYVDTPGGSTKTTNSTLQINSVTISATNSRSYILKVSALPKEREILLSLVFNDTMLVESADKMTYTLDPRNKTVPFKPVTRYTPESSSASGDAAKAISTATTIAMAIGSIVTFNYAMMMMKIYQMMEFMLLYNVAYPYNFQQFILLFKTIDPLSMLPDVFESLYDDTCADLGEKFVLQNMGCQFLNNCGSTVFVILIFFAFRLLFNGLYLIFKTKKGKIATFIQKTHHGSLGPRGMYSMISMFEMDLLLGAFTNSKYYAGDSTRTVQNIGNYLVSQTIVYCHPMIILFYFHKTRQVYLHKAGQLEMSEEELGRYEFLAEDRKEERWYHKYSEVLGMVRSYLICLTVVGLYDRSSLQILFPTVFIAFTLVMETVYRPQTAKMPGVLSVLTWTLYLGLSSSFAGLLFADSRLTKESVYTVFGYPMICLFCGLIALNLVPIVIAAVTKVWNLIKKCRQKGEKFDAVPSKDGLPDGKPDSIGEVSDIANAKLKPDLQSPPLVVSKVVPKRHLPFGSMRPHQKSDLNAKGPGDQPRKVLRDK